MLETCADAFGRKRLGHAHRPPGRSMAGQIFPQARFSSLGAALAARCQTSALIRRSNTNGLRGDLHPPGGLDRPSASLRFVDLQEGDVGGRDGRNPERRKCRRD